MTAVSAAAGWLSDLIGPSSLAEVEAEVAQDYPGVRQMQADELADQIERRTPLLLLDARTPEEYAVSHLAGARRIAPEASVKDVEQAVEPLEKGARVVIYCSVGYRSSRLAARVQDALLADGAAEVVNLRGGIFGWFNDGRPLVDARGPTHHVHPYNARWGRLLKPDAGSAGTAQSQGR